MSHQSRLAGRALIMALGLFWFVCVYAENGRLEINQICAVSLGCFAGDAPGFPVTIAAAGSYVLTSNLGLASSQSAIESTVAGVQLDLNGFEIAGAGSCTTMFDALTTRLTSIICSGSTGTAVAGVDFVHNGSVRGFLRGIDSATSPVLRVERMAIRENGTGIDSVGDGLLMTDSIISTNVGGVTGQNGNSRFTVRSCVFERNGQGIYLANGIVSESMFHRNNEALRSNVGGRALVLNSSFTANTESITGARSVFRSNVFTNNGTVPTGTNLGNNICDLGPC